MRWFQKLQHLASITLKNQRGNENQAKTEENQRGKVPKTKVRHVHKLEECS